MVLGYGDEENTGPKHAKDYPPEEVVPQVVVPEPTPGLGGIDSNIKPEVPEVTGKFGIPWKSIIGFFTVFVGQLLARATVDGVAVLPDNAGAWLTLFGGSFTAALIIFAKSNIYTVPQAQKNLAKAEKRASAVS